MDVRERLKETLSELAYSAASLAVPLLVSWAVDSLWAVPALAPVTKAVQWYFTGRKA